MFSDNLFILNHSDLFFSSPLIILPDLPSYYLCRKDWYHQHIIWAQSDDIHCTSHSYKSKIITDQVLTLEEHHM